MSFGGFMSGQIKLNNDDYQLARGSVKSGDLETLESLIQQQKIDPKWENSELLRMAAESQQPHIVEYLIPLSDPKAMNSLALRWACEKTGIECVQLLLPHSDPTAENSAALRLAVTYGNYDAARLLFDLCDPQKALQDLLDRPARSYGRKNVPAVFRQLWEEHESQKIREKIYENLEDNSTATLKRKM